MERKMAANDDENELKQAFKVFDQSNSGFITSHDLNHVMTNVFIRESFTDYEIDAMINVADADNDGKVSYEGIIYEGAFNELINFVFKRFYFQIRLP